MRSVLLLLILVSTLPRVSRAHVRERYFTLAECEALLERPPVDDDVAFRRGTQLTLWPRMSHPSITNFIARASSTDDLHALLFLTTGFTLPPRPSLAWQPTSQPERYWRSAVTVRNEVDSSLWNGKHILSRRFSSTINRFDGPRYQGSERRQRVAQFLSASFDALGKLTDPAHRRPGKDEFSSVVEFEIEVPVEPASDAISARANVRLEDLNTEDLDHLSRAYDDLGDEGVRTWVAYLTNVQLVEIVGKQQEFCRRLASVRTVNRFGQAYWAVVAPRYRPEEGLYLEMLLDKAVAKSETLRFGSAEIDGFLEHVRADDDWSKTRADLQAAAGLLGAALFQLNGSFADRLNWKDLLARLEPNAAAVDRVRLALGERQMNIHHVTSQFEAAEASLEKLDRWVGDVNARVSALTVAPENLASRPIAEQRQLRSILAMLPSLEDVLSLALGTIRRRLSAMTETLDASARIHLSIAAVGQEELSRARDGDQIDSESYRTLRTDLERLVAGEALCNAR